MGGIEGVIGTMSKVQKFMGTMQQMAPMLKLVAGSLGVKDAEDDKKKSRRKKRRKKLVRKSRPLKAKRK
jgi:hypothetical protein